tara:strand:+ start:195 stop:965 length:771 start_codon:yes stop_codon:yes gene_type:complete
MDYLNYGNKVQQKPQGFGNQAQLTKDDFSFGDLSQQITKPQVAPPPPTQDQLLQLFPTPVLISSYPFDYSNELKWIKNQSCEREGKSPNINLLNRQSKDTFILDNPEMSRVKQFIDSKLKEFVINVMGSDSELVITQSWVNRNGKGESHHDHKHPNSMISGVWYPQIHEELPPIQFKIGNQRDVELTITKYNNFNSATFLIPMKAGELIIFPSNLSHCVPANQSDEERISLSFNTWCKGNMGSERSLTYLPFDRLM